VAERIAETGLFSSFHLRVGYLEVPTFVSKPVGARLQIFPSPRRRCSNLTQIPERFFSKAYKA